MTPKEILIAARARIEDPEHWTRWTPAKTSQKGFSVRATDPSATCFCATGAIQSLGLPKHLEDQAYHLLAAAIDRPYTADPRDAIESFNDSRRGHSEVLAAFDKAIQNAS